MQNAIDELARRIAQIETREEVIIARAEGASRAAAMSSATASLAEIARRLGAVEENLRLGNDRRPIDGDRRG